mgnify:CR=1 FL=1
MEANSALDASFKILHTISLLILLVVFCLLINGVISSFQRCIMDQSPIFKKTQELKTPITTSFETLPIQKPQCNGGQIKRNTKTEFSLNKHLILLLFLSKPLIDHKEPNKLQFKHQHKLNLQDLQALLKSHSEAHLKATPQQQLLLT